MTEISRIRKGGMTERRDLENSLLQNYHSFSGPDIRPFFFVDPFCIDSVRNTAKVEYSSGKISEVTFNRIVNLINEVSRSPIVGFGEIQTLTVSMASSVGPVRRLGENKVIQYLNGARTIAGSMVFAMLNRDIFASILQGSLPGYRKEAFTKPEFIDEIPPFQILINGENEYGASASGLLVDVKMTNFGTTFSVDDLYTEATYSYVAGQYVPFVDDPIAVMNQKMTSTQETSVSQMALRNTYSSNGNTLNYEAAFKNVLNSYDPLNRKIALYNLSLLIAQTTKEGRL